jgi:uncharacterized RDD family membrane protein YckC
MTAIIALVIMARPAGFWIRAVAALIDFGVFAVVRMSLGVLAARVWRMDVDAALGLSGVLFTCTALFVVLYVVTLHTLDGQTLGKLIVRVRVIDANGAAPALGASVLRFIGYFLSLLPFGFGFIMAGLRTDRRALHDLLAGTHVERLGARAPTSYAVPPPPLVTPPL